MLSATATAREQSIAGTTNADVGHEVPKRIADLVISSNESTMQIAAHASQQLTDIEAIELSLQPITDQSGLIEQRASAVATAQVELGMGGERASATIGRFETDGLVSRGLTFALPFDLNAWAPAHNSVYSKHITGDQATDLVGNRTKRFFLDSAALTRASRMELGVDLPLGEALTRAAIRTAGASLTEPADLTARPFLLQTYARDTGAALSTLSVPLYVKGERFGCVCLGWDPEALRYWY